MDANITLDGLLRGCLECGVVVIDPRRQVTCLNAPAATFLSFHPVLPASVEGLPPPVLEFVQQAFASSCQLGAMEVRIPTAGQSAQVLTLEACPLACNGDQTSLLLVLRGMQVNHPLEAKIRHFERLARLGVLSASLAHELRNSMVALSAMADLLIEQQRDNELAQTVRGELDRANSLAVRMLKYARPNSQPRKAASTHEILDRVLQLANSRLKEAGATLTKSLQADPDLISADEPHLEQMFLNLLINAADAIHSSGEVILTTDVVQQEKVGHAVRIAVRDSGGGISAEILPHLFQPFFTTKRHGTGLGLYLAQQIIDEHCGCIQVDSTPGQGTCVQVYLPVHQD